MNLGQFSVSLAVKDIHASRAFYENLGFSVMDGKLKENWLILKNGEAVIGLFQGMFEKNLMTFNPKDVRSIAEVLDKQGVSLSQRPEGESGQAFLSLEDPDGNQILMDQWPDDYKADPQL